MSRGPLHIERLRRNPLHQQMLENSRQAAEEHQRVRRRVYVCSILAFYCWTAVAVGLASWGMGTVRWAHHSRAIIEAGVLLGGAGILCTLLFAYSRLGR
jgi:DNA-binding HxlR family transcriptional regulator